MKIKCTILSLFIAAGLPVLGQTLSDQQATSETVNLYSNLSRIPGKGYLIGHQDALAYGAKWKYVAGKSDIKDVTGDYPAVYGWELGGIENGSALNLDSVPFAKMRTFIMEGYKRGGVITISWHGNNPMTGKTAWDPASGTVAAILPGQPKHEVFVKQLDKVADFLASLKGEKGEAIPILYRPFHELTGEWFWWGTKGTKPEEFKALFRFTVDYLRNKKHLHNLIIGYNTSNGLQTKDDFLERYPGDKFVDMVSFDAYQRGSTGLDNSFNIKLNQDLSIIEQVAKERRKIAAVGELGFNNIPYAEWFTHAIQPAFKKHQFAYVLFWRNAGYKSKENETEYYTPYPGHPAATDFLKYYNASETLFQKEASELKLYEKK